MTNQNLTNIFGNITHKILKEVPYDGTYGDMQYDSREVQDGDIFVALEGAVVDGHDYIDDAVARGAKVILVSREIATSHKVTYIYVENLRAHLGEIASNYYGKPQEKLTIIGFTGTNGKTSSTYFLEKILGEDKCARIGTIEYKVGKKVVEAQNTTPESLDIVKICKDAVEAGITYLIMEVSSHALCMGRVDMLDFAIGSFTNLTQDHLDYHETMENYFMAKRKLFTKSKKSVINIDDEYGMRLYDEFGANGCISYGIDKPADITGEIISMSPVSQHVRFNIFGKSYECDIKLLGRFNLYNLLGVIGVAKSLDIPDDEIIAVVANLHGAPGRYELVNCGNDFSVIVDYSHTDDSLRNILESLNEFKKNRIITVFGCGGDRDKTKRPKMGKVAETLSDITIVTSDNPRTEDPEAIIKDILAGLTKDNHIVVVDREQAIIKAIQMAEPDDIVLLAGKGHEDYQVIGRTKCHCDDREIARRELVRKKS